MNTLVIIDIHTDVLGSRVHVTSMFPRWRALSVVNQVRTVPDLLCLQKKLCQMFKAQV